MKTPLQILSRGGLTMRGNVVFRIRREGFGVRFSAFSQGGAHGKLAMVLLEEGCRS